MYEGSPTIIPPDLHPQAEEQRSWGSAVMRVVLGGSSIRPGLEASLPPLTYSSVLAEGAIDPMSDTQIQPYAPPRKSSTSNPALAAGDVSSGAGREVHTAPGPVPALNRSVLISKHGKPVMGAGGRQMRLMLGKRHRQK